LVAEVSLAHVGIVFGLDISRLARSNRDWHHLARIIHHPKNRSEKGFLKPSEASKQPYPRLVTLPKAGCQIVLTLCQAV
jgi:hypothetical protein